MNDDAALSPTGKWEGDGSDANPDGDHSAPSARDLLFGRLTVLNGFVDEKTVQAASRQAGPSQSLGEVLVESGAISEEDRQAIEKLLERHLAKHGDDPGQSLSAFSPTVSFVVAESESGTLISHKPDGTPSSSLFGDYELIGELARGGMGVVYKARQRKLNRIVALKMIRSGELADDEQVDRFYSEAEAAAKLDHAGIVPVFEVGETNGQHYYSMALIEGQSLHSKIKDEGPLTAKHAASIIKSVAESVQFAHESGIVHRDIKPQNILIDETGQPRVTDFGLAKDIHNDSGLTATGQVMGTPSYMAPEQATGSVNAIGPSCDVYALGGTLYFLLTGRPPFQAASAVETIRQVMETEPVPLRRFDAAIPRDVETICLKCLRKDDEKRYDTAGELADDLKRWLESMPIVARPVRRWEKVWLWCKRRPAVASLLVAIAVLAVTGTEVALERQSATHAAGLVDTLVKADTAEVSRIVSDIDGYRKWVDPLLHQRFEQAEDESTEKLHLAIALVQRDEKKIDYLRDRLLIVPYNQFPAVRDALTPFKPNLIEGLWKDVDDNELPDKRRFQAACALATYDNARSENWRNTETAEFVATHLVSVRPSELLPWTNALRPVKSQLIDAISTIYRNPIVGEQVRSFAADTLADYLADDADGLFDLLVDADEQQFAPIFNKLNIHREKAVALGTAEVAKTITDGASEADKESLAMRQANAAVMLLRMDAADQVWPLLKHSPDPRVRSYIIHWLSPRGGEPKTIIARYEIETDVTIKRALLLCLGEFELSESDKQPLIETLLVVYRNDPDAGLHAAAEWLLRQWEQGKRLTAIDKELQRKEAEFVATKDNQRQWYVNSQGQTFVILDAGEFQMGSSEAESSHDADESLHRRKIGRQIAIATKEVTHEQWRVFSEANAEMSSKSNQEKLRAYIRSDHSPMIFITWYEAAHYCNWLSEQERIPEDQWCYEKNEKGKFGPGMKAKENFWKLTGYRLPTEAEWEFASRAGSETSRYYGVTEVLLPHYAWYLANAEDQTHPVAGLKPNDFGLFDMQGNVYEWCYDAVGRSATPKEEAVSDTPIVKSVEDTGRRVLRGGGFFNRPVGVRSGVRTAYLPANRGDNVGFRPVRSCRLHPNRADENTGIRTGNP